MSIVDEAEESWANDLFRQVKQQRVALDCSLSAGVVEWELGLLFPPLPVGWAELAPCTFVLTFFAWAPRKSSNNSGETERQRDKREREKRERERERETSAICCSSAGHAQRGDGLTP